MSMRISAAATSIPLASQLSRAPSVSRPSQSAAAAKQPVQSAQAVRKPTEIGKVHQIANALRQALNTEGSSLKERVEGNGGKMEVGLDKLLAKERLNIGRANFKSPAAQDAMAELEEVIRSKAPGSKGSDPTSMAGMIDNLQQKMIEQHGATGHLLNMVA